MLQKLKNILGFGAKVNINELIANGAQVIDVRSKGEYSSGHHKGSINIPLDQLHENLKKLRNSGDPIVTCCASGMRSGAAKRYLKSQGFTNVHNGGSWHSLKY